MKPRIYRTFNPKLNKMVWVCLITQEKLDMSIAELLRIWKAENWCSIQNKKYVLKDFYGILVKNQYHFGGNVTEYFCEPPTFVSEHIADYQIYNFLEKAHYNEDGNRVFYKKENYKVVKFTQNYQSVGDYLVYNSVKKGFKAVKFSPQIFKTYDKALLSCKDSSDYVVQMVKS